MSPSTRRIDRGEKLDNYRLIPSLTDYLIVAQDEVWIDRFVRRRGRWELEEHSSLSDRLLLTEIGCKLPLSDVYEKVFAAE